MRLRRLGMIDLPAWGRYGVAALAVALGVLLRLALSDIWPPTRLPFLTFFPAIMVAGWLGGLGPGLVATALAGLLCNYYWIEPVGRLSIEDAGDAVGLVIFLASGTLVSAINALWRREAHAAVDLAERLRTTLHSIGDAVIATDGEARITHINPIAESLTGWTAADAIGRPLADVFVIINEQTRAPAPNPVTKVLADGVIAGLANHTVLLTRDGREVPIDDSAAPIRDAGGRVVGVVLVFRNITARRESEHALAAALEAERLARSQLDFALEAGRMGTWQYTLATGEVRWSPGLEAIHGRVPGTFPGTIDAFKAEIHPDDLERVLTAIGDAAQHRREHHVEYRIVRADGAVRWVEGRGMVVCDAAGTPERMVGVCADITDRVEALQGERLAAEQISRAKDDFLALLSHELRNPLATILGWVRMLQAGGLTAARMEHALQVIERNARAEVRLVDSLLDSSRIVAATLDVAHERADLTVAVEAAVDALLPAAGDKDIVIDAQLTPGPLIVIGDEGRLQQIVVNLLSNAVKFTPRGGRVRVTLAREKSQAVIRVTDSGDGIAPEFLPRLFERFRQADTGRRRARGGLGLGLAIARELTRAHGGAIAAHSDGQGRGATFTVTIPIPPVVTSEVEAPPRADAIPEPSLAGLRILVVDDDPDARELLDLTLQTRGADVRTASSAAQALELVQDDWPQALVADIGMPNEDGFTLLQKIRARERFRKLPRLPAIALTAYAGTGDREQATAVGYDLHLAKPVEAADLARALVGVRDAAAAPAMRGDRAP